MKLPTPFVRIPLRFDAGRLREEVEQMDASRWQPHRSGFEGNAFIRLVSEEGKEHDLREGPMQPTAILGGCPYTRQVLASFRTVVGAVRLMKIAAGAEVPSHVDVNPYWTRRVRIHVPVLTHPGVSFACGGTTVHMEEGEAWVLDNWRRHAVRNAGETPRIHLVVDTAGSPGFWALFEAGAALEAGQAASRFVPYDPEHDPDLVFEQNARAQVVSPEQVELQLQDVLFDLRADSGPDVRQWCALLEAHCRAWWSTWMAHRDQPTGWPHYAGILQQTLRKADALGDACVLRTNDLSVRKAVVGRLSASMNLPGLPGRQSDR